VQTQQCFENIFSPKAVLIGSIHYNIFYNSSVTPSLLCGCEIWSLKQRDMRR